MSRTKGAEDRLRVDKAKLLKSIKAEEADIKELYRALVYDFVNIAQVARGNRATTIMTRLKRYGYELEELRRIANNPQLRAHLKSLIERINLFIIEFKRGAYLGADEKVRSIIAFIFATLKDTVLKDLDQQYATFEDLENQFARSM